MTDAGWAALDLQDAGAVEEAFRSGAEACRTAVCRRGSIEVITPPGTLIATGDLHDNPINFGKLVRLAGFDGSAAGDTDHKHLLLHEIIHSDRLIGGVDFSYRALARVAALKAEHPELVHVLLANHELAQVVGAGIVKNGVRVVEAFDAGLEHAFGDEADSVADAIDAFVRALPLALRIITGSGGDVLCAHSIPGVGVMSKFDPGILSRDLTDDDYTPRQGSAHLMVWGRGYDADQIEDLVERWGVGLFILGHEHAEHGARLVPPNVLVLNSDHERGVYLPIDLDRPPRAEEAAAAVIPLSSVSDG